MTNRTKQIFLQGFLPLYSPFTWLWQYGVSVKLFFLTPFIYFLRYLAFTRLEYFYIPTSQPCPNKKAKPLPIKFAFL